MKKFTSLVGLYLTIFLLHSSLSNQLIGQIVAKKVTASTGQVVPFLQYKPSTHDASPPTRRYPMIIFLHGGGERSNNTALVPAPPTTPWAPVWQLTAYGPLRERGWHNMGFTWDGITDTLIIIHPLSKDSATWPVAYINAVIDYGIDSLKADSNRICLAGHSYGGAGVFNYLNSSSANVNKLAAAIPIAAWNTILNATGANNVSNAKLPVWAFHALDDNITDPNMTINSMNTLNGVTPQVKPLVTLWPSGTITPNPHHHAPDHVFNLHQYPYLEDGVINIYEWFLGQNKSLSPNVLPVASAGPDQAIATSPGTATLDGTGSSDADGIVRYFWRQISGPTSISISNTHTTSTAAAAAHATKSITGLTVVGTYEFELSVVDARAGISKDSVQITVAGQAIAITTTGGRILAGNISQLKNAPAFTLEAYVKHDGIITDWSNSEACIVRNHITATDRVKLTIDKATNSVHFTLANGADVKGYTASNVVSPNTWYHIAAVYDGAQAVNTDRLKIYINGVSQSLTFTGTITATTSGSSPSYLFGGEPSASKVVAIDEVRVWTTAIPQATINSWKDITLGNCHPDFNKLIVYWPLDDGASPSVSAGLGTAYTGGLHYANYIYK